MSIDSTTALILIRPSEQYKIDVLAYRDEFLQNTENIDGTASLGHAPTFEKWLCGIRNDEKEETVQKGHVPASEYLAIRASDKRLVGMVSIRHRLNSTLRFQGGHIGYSVRKSERRKGYATEMLKQALSICKKMNITSVVLTCYKANIGSASVIIANGGVLQEEFTSHEGTPAQRYVITLS